ncbi:uncharacterized protein [Arachis hypogaea]|uniref:uncharacterized protein n=1 Tax=Arachis hypogaea TaxID=3818 RepID=UPI000DEC6933|nr:uncharacterized protein LOC112697853 isoform X2 [Arachis hypogaea]XP_025660396.1 uncharacterized protein LOC112756152 isoform X2 [Arachis hypogaea]QHN88451.1 uncharacterized protein DS421_16g563660 [Arachis hypogaea]
MNICNVNQGVTPPKFSHSSLAIFASGTYTVTGAPPTTASLVICNAADRHRAVLVTIRSDIDHHSALLVAICSLPPPYRRSRCNSWRRHHCRSPFPHDPPPPRQLSSPRDLQFTAAVLLLAIHRSPALPEACPPTRSFLLK